MQKDFEQLPHTADIKVRVYGTTKEALFCNALRAMFHVIGPQSNKCEKQDNRFVCKEFTAKHAVKVQAPDIEALLVDFLSEALYLSDVYNQAYFDADITQLTDYAITATIKGVAITGFEVVEIKAVTYHDLRITQTDGVWQTDIVFDI